MLHRVLQTQTNDMAVFEDLCAKATPTEAVLQHLASGMRSHSPKPYFVKVMPMDSESTSDVASTLRAIRSIMRVGSADL